MARRLQRALLAFGALALTFLLAVYAIAPGTYVQALNGSVNPSDPHPPDATLFLAAILIMVGMLGVGVLRRWRWVFWVVLIACALSVLQIPAAALELKGILPMDYPAWYLVTRALVAAVQFAIGIAMICMFLHRGVWARGR